MVACAIASSDAVGLGRLLSAIAFSPQCNRLPSLMVAQARSPHFDLNYRVASDLRLSSAFYAKNLLKLLEFNGHKARQGLRFLANLDPNQVPSLRPLRYLLKPGNSAQTLTACGVAADISDPVYGLLQMIPASIDRTAGNMRILVKKSFCQKHK